VRAGSGAFDWSGWREGDSRVDGKGAKRRGFRKRLTVNGEWKGKSSFPLRAIQRAVVTAEEVTLMKITSLSAAIWPLNVALVSALLHKQATMMLDMHGEANEASERNAMPLTDPQTSSLPNGSLSLVSTSLF